MQQLREAVAAQPDGIAMMGHPGDAAIMPLAEQASKAGIKMMYQNVPVPQVVAAFGGGYVGAQQEPQGRALGAEAFKLAGLKAGDKAIVLGPFENENRGARERGTVAAIEGGRASTSSSSARRRPANGRPIRTSRSRSSPPRSSTIPTSRSIGYPGGQMLGNVPTYMQAAGKKPGDIFNFGFDTSPQIVEAFKGGWVQLTADQQPFLQGYLPILSLCQQVVYGLAPMNVDTGAGFVTPENYEIVAKLATEAPALDRRRTAGRMPPAGMPDCGRPTWPNN